MLSGSGSVRDELGAYTLRTDDIRARCAAAVARLPVGGDVPVRVVFERVKRTRSQQQNAYYWGVVLRSAAQETGHHPDELHEYFKSRFLVAARLTVGDDTRDVPASTTRLTTGQFAEYVDRVVLFLAELGCIVPPAGEYA